MPHRDPSPDPGHGPSQGDLWWEAGNALLLSEAREVLTAALARELFKAAHLRLGHVAVQLGVARDPVAAVALLLVEGPDRALGAAVARAPAECAVFALSPRGSSGSEKSTKSSRTEPHPAAEPPARPPSIVAMAPVVFAAPCCSESNAGRC